MFKEPTAVRAERIDVSFRPSSLAVALTLFVALSGCKSSGPQKAQSDQKKATASSASAPGRSAQELFVEGNDHLDPGQWEKAISAYREAAELDSGRWDVYLNLAIAYSKTNQFNEAIGAAEQALAHGGEERPEVYYNLGNIYQKRGLYHQAIRTYRAALAHGDERDVDTLINIATCLTIIGEKHDARQTYQRAQAKAPRDPRIQHGFAVLLSHEGKYRQAVDAYQKLHSMAPDYAPGYFDEAGPHANAGNYRKAIEALEKYLQVAPDGEYADTAEARIELYRNKADGSAE